MSSIEVVEKFLKLVEEEHTREASKLLSENVKMIGVGVTEPRGIRLEGRQAFMIDSSKVLRDDITWGPIRQGHSEYQVVCDGTRKEGLLGTGDAVPALLHKERGYKRTFEVSKDGSIVDILIERA